MKTYRTPVSPWMHQLILGGKTVDEYLPERREYTDPDIYRTPVAFEILPNPDMPPRRRVSIEEFEAKP